MKLMIMIWCSLLLVGAAALPAATVRPRTAQDGLGLNRRAAQARHDRKVANGGSRNVVIGSGDTVLPQFVDGGYWSTEITLTNLDSHTISFGVDFIDEAGSDLTVPVVGQGRVVGMDLTLSPMESFTFETEGTDAKTAVGWAQLILTSQTDRIGGLGVLRLRIPGNPDYEAVVPVVNEFETRFVLLYDNTQVSGLTSNYNTGFAIANPDPNAATVDFTVRAEDGSVLDRGSITLQPWSHMSDEVGLFSPPTARRRGSIEFSTASAGVSAMGLRFNPTGPFTSVHVLTAYEWTQ